jgi:hypothetical protein
VRGGGSSVGVVTALEMTLYPVRQLYAGALFFPIQRSAQVLHAWQAWTGTIPDEVTSLGRILRLPSLPEVPEPLRSRAFALVEAAYLGDADTGAALIQPLRQLGPELDTFATIPAAALAQLHMDPAQPVPFQGDGALLADAPVATIDALVALTGPDADTSLASIEIRHLGGPLARSARDAGAQPRRSSAMGSPELAQYADFYADTTPPVRVDRRSRALAGHLRAATSAHQRAGGRHLPGRDREWGARHLGDAGRELSGPHPPA